MSPTASGTGGSAQEQPTPDPGQHARHHKVDLTWVPAALATMYESLPLDPASVVEGLDGASCGPRIKDLASFGIGVAAKGGAADEWRSRVLDRAGVEAAPLLAETETCMRGSGLWPWPR